MVQSIFAEQVEQESLAKRIRTFLRDLFGSRVIEVMQNSNALLLAEKEQSFVYLQEELARTRDDYEKRLKDKDDQLADLRAEKAMMTGKIHEYEMAVMPTASRAGADFVAAGQPKRKPNFPEFNVPPPESRWQAVQREHDAEMQRQIIEEQKALKASPILGGVDG